MTIVAKFAGKCAVCGGAIHAGEKIEWKKGGATRHAECPSNPTPVAPKARKQAVPRLPKLVGDEGKVQVRFEGTKSDRTPDKYTVGECVWIKDRGELVAMMCVGYEPAWWCTSDSLEDNGDYGFHGRGAFLGLVHFRTATPVEYEALQVTNPRLSGVCAESLPAVALSRGMARVSS